MMRPRPARWFEALVARDDCTLALAALAATGAVELEARSGAKLPGSFLAIRPALARFADFQLRYGAYWPATGLAASTFPEPPGETLERGLALLDRWANDAEPLIRTLQANEAERSELVRWKSVLAALGPGGLDLGALAAAGPLTRARLLEYPAGAETAPTTRALVRRIEAEGVHYALAVAGVEDLEALSREAVALKGRSHPLPEWLGDDPAANEARIARRLEELAAADGAAREALEALHHRHGLHRALADLLRLQWVIANVHALESGDHFAFVTGWTSDLTGEAIVAAIEGSGARALAHFPEPPRALRAPLLFSNPAWARPFEMFPRALGMPGSEEADPTVILALVLPLIFGYMFGDVGQGLVIAVAAWFYRKRVPVARLLMAGGVASVFFGFAFGSVFSFHGAVAPLWHEPLEAPITILAVPLAGGALLLATGLLLNALGSYWRGETARLIGEDLGLLAVYAGLLGTFLDARALWLSAAGVAAFLAGHAIHAGRASAAAGAIAELVEKALQLAINTLSFARVGAFALAHAGLSAAVVALATEADSLLARIAIVVVGNVLIIALEAMVVSIQTTRLVLFEFFARFLGGTGRPFRALSPPPFTASPSPKPRTSP